MASFSAFKSLNVLGHDYAYLDSGAPASTNYTTWVMLHGLGFNGVIFEKLLPLAHAHNLRIVSVNRRGYPPSSGFHDDELEGIGFGKKFEEAEPFFRAQGTEIATFLVQFANAESIPLADPDGATGGIVLIGWSLASIHIIMLLAYADELPEGIRTTLQKYLHTVLSHDGNTVFGFKNPDKFDVSLWTEPDDRKRFDAFGFWVTGHYAHRSAISGDIEDLEFNRPSDVPHSLHELSSEERSKYVLPEVFAFTSAEVKLLFCDDTAFVALTKRALFDKRRAEALPDVRVRYMAGGESPGILVWTVWMLQQYVAHPESLYGHDAERARDVRLLIQPDGNHFVFWEDPEKAIAQFDASIRL